MGNVDYELLTWKKYPEAKPERNTEYLVRYVGTGIFHGEIGIEFRYFYDGKGWMERDKEVTHWAEVKGPRKKIGSPCL